MTGSMRKRSARRLGAAPIRVCYFGTYRRNYSRNVILIQALRDQGIVVEECHATLWRGIGDRVEVASGGWLRPRFLARLLLAGIRLIHRYLETAPHDAVVVGYPGTLDIFLAKSLAALRRVPVVWDVFMSPFLVARERGLGGRSPVTVRILKAVEGVALRVPDLLIQDTAQYVAWLHRVHRVPVGWFRLVPTGADDRVFLPAPHPPAGSPMTVLYYGSFIPNHGVGDIVDAATVMKDDSDVRFVLIGAGPEREKAERTARERRLGNVTFLDWMSREELVAHAHRAAVCLGAFGETPQSLMTVQNKIYECMSMRRPVITGESEAVSAQFRNGEHLVTCARRDGRALAVAIRGLFDDPEGRERIAAAGHREFRARYSIRALGTEFRAILAELPGAGRR